jgi:hypothetical protein
MERRERHGRRPESGVRRSAVACGRNRRNFVHVLRRSGKRLRNVNNGLRLRPGAKLPNITAFVLPIRPCAAPMLDLKSYRPETFDGDSAHVPSWPRLAEADRSFEGGARPRCSATVPTWGRSPYARDGVLLAPVLAGRGRTEELASSLVRASVGFLVSVALLVVLMTGLAALS